MTPEDWNPDVLLVFLDQDRSLFDLQLILSIALFNDYYSKWVSLGSTVVSATKNCSNTFWLLTYDCKTFVAQTFLFWLSESNMQTIRGLEKN